MQRLSFNRSLPTIIAILIIATFFLFPPVTIFDKSYAIGYAICHQLPDRTFHFGGVALPLCSRCTGIYLGVLIGLIAVPIRRRYYAVELPPTGILTLLLFFILLMLFDGLNSYLEFSDRLPQLYPSQNWLRLTTGTFHGIAIGTVIYPVFSHTLWQPALRQNVAVIENVRELVLMLVAGIGTILLVLWQNPILLYPMMLLSSLGVITILGMVSTIVVIAVSRREASAAHWTETIIPILSGLALTFLLIGGIDWVKSSIFRATGIE
jgi:uncharacterized membrane protein